MSSSKKIGIDNPYLQHRPANERGVGSTSKVADPLEGLVPRFVTANQAKTVLVSVNSSTA